MQLLATGQLLIAQLLLFSFGWYQTKPEAAKM
jgi:hypothetical protein